MYENNSTQIRTASQRGCGFYHPPHVRPGICRLIPAALIASVCIVPEAANSASFFATSDPSLDHLPATGIYPQGQKIGFGLYTIVGVNRFDNTKTNMQRAVEEGFTLAGPYFFVDWQDFRSIHEAAAYGLPYTYQIRAHPDVIWLRGDERSRAIARLSEDEIATSVRTQVETVIADPIANATVARWSFGLEEVRHWHATEMNYLRIARETIRQVELKHGLEHRPFWMYESNNRDSSSLQLTGVHQDIVSKGSYLTRAYDRGDRRAGWSMWSLNQIVDSAEKLDNVPQVILELYQDFDDPRTGTDPAEIRRVIRHDTYLGLVKGVKSLSVWSMFENRPELTTHNEQFEAYGSVARELTGDLNLQRVFLFGEEKDDLYLKITRGQRTVPYTHTDGVHYEYPALNSFHAAIDNARYLFLVNSSESEMDVIISGLPQHYFLSDLFADEIRQMRNSPLTRITLPALGVSALRFTERRPRHFKYSLDPSSLLLPEPGTSQLFCFAILLAGLYRRRFVLCNAR